LRYAILGDIHGNLEALQSVLDSCKLESVDRFVCVGDIVGYGADPEKCVAIVREINPIIVCGNHDWGCTGLVDLDYFHTAARESIEWTRYFISSETLLYLRGLPLIVQNKNFIIVHSTLDVPEEFDYMINAKIAEQSFVFMDVPLCFVGHIHIPIVFQKLDQGAVDYCYDWRIEVSQDIKQIISVGSVGQPRDGDPRACYVIYDEEKGIVEIKRVEYDIESTQKKICNAGLHPILATRLAEGR
jgi:diadenosine tetraphosphatase ApaH/serine/threonine PP2A family protein phosphatase